MLSANSPHAVCWVCRCAAALNSVFDMRQSSTAGVLLVGIACLSAGALCRKGRITRALQRIKEDDLEHSRGLTCVFVPLQELRGLGMTATNEEPEWKVAALGKVRRTPILPAALQPARSAPRRAATGQPRFPAIAFHAFSIK
jgi:hypothetical protein